ncbi:FGGY-family carbohydrate kinase [Aliihoeflea sp. PC F10.4]
MEGDFVVAVDVGTASVRAGILDRQGHTLAHAEHPIAMHRPLADHAEHDSQDIWEAVCRTVRTARENANLLPEAIAAIGFDATCSIVVRGRTGEQISVSTTGEARWDTIAWLDHRAAAEADRCTATGHEVVAHCGGSVSPEMATPKLAWLKAHLPESWQRAAHFFDLADFLTWKASGSSERSICTLGCKWAYLAHRDDPWPRDYLDAVGISDMLERGGLPNTAVLAGTDLGPLTPEAADALGLTSSCRVAAGFIDAHAGALAALGTYADDPNDLPRRAALVAGTSSCVTTLSTDAVKMNGIWGPYLDATLPGLWLSEGGQSVSGGLLDHLVHIHGAGQTADRATHERIFQRIGELQAIEGRRLSGRLHVLPDFHGNRSPAGDPHALGVVSGMALDPSFDGLCRIYWRTAVAIALGIRQIVETMNANGRAIDTLHFVGGHTRSPLLTQLYADATGCEIVTLDTPSAMLLGTAAAASTAAGWHATLADACRAMRRNETRISPDREAFAQYDRDYRIFQRMQAHRAEIEDLSRAP